MIRLYFLRFAEKIDIAALPAVLQQSGILRAVEELKMLNQSDVDRERYEARRKFQHDYNSAMGFASRQGELIGLIHAFETMLRKTETPREQLLALQLEDLERIAADVKQQALARA